MESLEGVLGLYNSSEHKSGINNPYFPLECVIVVLLLSILCHEGGNILQLLWEVCKQLPLVCEDVFHWLNPSWNR